MIMMIERTKVVKIWKRIDDDVEIFFCELRYLKIFSCLGLFGGNDGSEESIAE